MSPRAAFLTAAVTLLISAAVVVGLEINPFRIGEKEPITPLNYDLPEAEFLEDVGQRELDFRLIFHALYDQEHRIRQLEAR